MIKKWHGSRIGKQQQSLCVKVESFLNLITTNKS